MCSSLIIPCSFNSDVCTDHVRSLALFTLLLVLCLSLTLDIELYDYICVDKTCVDNSMNLIDRWCEML